MAHLTGSDDLSLDPRTRLFMDVVDYERSVADIMTWPMASCVSLGYTATRLVAEAAGQVWSPSEEWKRLLDPQYTQAGTYKRYIKKYGGLEETYRHLFCEATPYWREVPLDRIDTGCLLLMGNSENLHTNMFGLYHDAIRYGELLTIVGTDFLPWTWTQHGLIPMEGWTPETVVLLIAPKWSSGENDNG